MRRVLGEEEEGRGRVGERVDNTSVREELVFTHLSDATISAALIWTICDFHGSIHRSGFSYKLYPQSYRLQVYVRFYLLCQK